MASDDDILKDERERFETAFAAESENRATALEDLKFGRMAEQWPEAIAAKRKDRPMLTINKMPAFIRQVVNDARQNRPQIKVKPVDDSADKDTANVIEGIVRNIEYSSKADIAYDTAVDNAASCGFGYIRLAIDYEYDDTFDKCIRIKRVANPFSVYGDPFSVEADSSDWNQAHVVEYLSKEEFRRKYRGAEEVDWDAMGYDAMQTPWREDNNILVCEAWSRSIVKRKILLVGNQEKQLVVGAKEYEAGRESFDILEMRVLNERETNGYNVTQRIMTGAEVLETTEWAGTYIPVVPVYGEEINIEGKRYFRSLIHGAKDAQRMFNYWRTTATELVALAPRVPYLGEEGAFDADDNWATANTESHPYLMHAKGTQPPQRQPLDSGTAIGAMSEAMAAGDDMKAIIGMYDASLGQRSNETSGKAIMARQREGDVSTFHFIDNLSRGIRHLGCCIVDLIPKVYSGQRMVRILGEDGKEEVRQIGELQDDQSMPMMDGAQPEDMGGQQRVYNLGLGKYDVAVSAGPGYTTRRQEAAEQMQMLLQSNPDIFPVIGDKMVKAMDWPGADEIAERLERMVPPQAKGEQEMPPEMQQMQADMKAMQAEAQQRIEQTEAEVQKLQQQVQALTFETKSKDLKIQELEAIDRIEAAYGKATAPQPAQQNWS